jgi:hypothetical protein
VLNVKRAIVAVCLAGLFLCAPASANFHSPAQTYAAMRAIGREIKSKHGDTIAIVCLDHRYGFTCSAWFNSKHWRGCARRYWYTDALTLGVPSCRARAYKLDGSDLPPPPQG